MKLITTELDAQEPFDEGPRKAEWETKVREAASQEKAVDPQVAVLLAALDAHRAVINDLKRGSGKCWCRKSSNSMIKRHTPECLAAQALMGEK
jgi:hypothetical protein